MAVSPPTRRDLLLGMLAGAAPLSLAQPAAGVRFGVRTPFPDLPLRERARLLRQIGFDGIELGNEWTNQSATEIKSQLEGTAIAVSALVGSIELLNTDPKKRQTAVDLDRRQLQKARILGAACVIEVPVFGENRFPDLSPALTPVEAEEQVLVAELKQLAGDVQQSGVTLLLEPCNHKETHFLNMQEHAAALIRRVDAPGFKVLSDFYHMQIEEKDIGETLGRMGHLTGYVHLADGEKRTEPGSLPFDYRPGFRALKKWNYSGWLTVESKFTDDPEAALSRALKYLKHQWAEA
ncbi:MAG TPA: sugar phosphate isomerase/epimerase family protein [Bryobacteraceae bacterium]